jgi:hypothetical protein
MLQGVFLVAAYDNVSALNVMDYITVATTGNATDFGDLIEGYYGLAGVSNATRGVFGGGDTVRRIQCYALYYYCHNRKCC